jgi:hypothetical protein
MKLKKKSPLKLLSQSQPNFAEMILGWSPSKMVSSISDLRPRCKDHSTKVWLQLVQWFMRRRFVCEFPIGFYVKLSSDVRAILVERPNHRTHFRKRTIQWLFHQNLVPVIPTSNQDVRQAKNEKRGDEI